jgi:hypothetical protein
MNESGSGRRDYQHDYYLKNKDELSKRRKSKYQNDPIARERAKESARLYRAKKKAERDRLRSEGKLPRAKSVGPREPIDIEIDGKMFKGYTITILSNRIGRSKDTINHWINIGTVPKTPFRSTRGDRLYTDGMILAIKMAIQSKGIIGYSSEIYNKISSDWMKIGVYPV